MVAGVLAIITGIVALVGLTGKVTVPRVWMRTVLAGLPVVAVSGAHFAPGGWNLTIAIGMTLSVVLGMLASLIGPAELSAPTGHWVAQGWRLMSVLLVGVVLGTAVIRWGASLMAPFPLLSPSALGVVLAIGAVAAAVGGAGLRGLVTTATVILLVFFVLVTVAGFAVGTPGLLTDPLVPVSHPVGAWLLFLVGFVLAATNPALRQIRAEGSSIIPGTIILGVVMFIGLVALLSFNGGYLQLPSFGMGTVAGYAGFSSPVPGAVLCGLIAVVILAAAILAYRSVFVTVESFQAPWFAKRWPLALAVGVLAALLSLYAVPLEPMLWGSALFALSGWIVAWWAGRRPADSDAGVDPVAVGQGRSDTVDR